MFLLQLSIIFQLTGALNAFAGLVIASLGFQYGLLTAGGLLMALGAIFFILGRITLKQALKRRLGYYPSSQFAPAQPQYNSPPRVRPSYFVDSAGQAQSAAASPPHLAASGSAVGHKKSYF
jgi:hypothetical protein